MVRIISLCLIVSMLLPVGILSQTKIEEREAFISPMVERTINRALDYLEKQQKSDGSWGKQYSIGGTAIVILAFLVNGHLPEKGKYGKTIKKGIDFILKNRDKVTGYIGRTMYEHGFATLVLADVFGEYKHPDLQDALEGAVQLMVNAQKVNGAGAWRYSPQSRDADISVSSAVIQALRAAREAFIFVPKGVMNKAAKFLKRCHTRDGGFSYTPSSGGADVARSGAGVLSLMACGKYNDKTTNDGIRWLFANPRLDRSRPWYGAYYCVQAMYQAGGRYWRKWYPKIQKQILALRRPDGSFSERQGRRGSRGAYTNISTAFYVISLSISKGLMPLFQR